jgi:transcriptional regulator with XRE-family HTH domain
LPVFQSGDSMPRSQHSDRYKALCALLADARRKRRLTQAAMAERLGRPQSYVSKYESGERRLDVIEFLDIADALSIQPIKLLRQV